MEAQAVCELLKEGSKHIAQKYLHQLHPEETLIERHLSPPEHAFFFTSLQWNTPGRTHHMISQGFRSPGSKGRLNTENRNNHGGSENTPHINEGRGDTLAQRSVSLPHQSLLPSGPEGKRETSVGLVGFWKHAAPGHLNHVEYF
eukprot:1161867-Pelagomonas_calceolata.AAC.5